MPTIPRELYVIISRRALLAATPVVVLTTRPASAQAFPVQQIRIVVPYPPGGPTDALARIVATELGAALKHTVIVENKPGASGVIGVKYALQLPADGHTLVLGNNQTHATNALLLKSAGYDPAIDFQPVAGLADLQHVLVVRHSLGVSSVEEFLSVARKTRLNYGSTGVGSGSHLAMELLAARAGVSMQHVAYKGAAQLALDIVTDQLDAALAIVPSVLSQINGGQVRALAVASRRRSPQLPAVRTLAEQGVTEAESDSWLALFTHATVPADIVARLGRIVIEGLGKPAVADALFRQGTAINLRSAPDFSLFHRDEIEKWAKVVKAANVMIEN